MKKIVLAALAVTAAGAFTVPAFAAGEKKAECPKGQKMDAKSKKCVPEKK